MAVKLGLAEIAGLMRRYLDEDSSRKSLVVEGKTLDEALSNAAIQL